MTTTHVSIPKSFSGGDTREWFQKFEICSNANGWDAEKKAKKLPTLLEGEALVAWMELSEEEKADYSVTKGNLIKKMAPLEFVSLEEFQERSIFPGESVSMYLYELKRLLQQAMPELTADTKKQLLIHQFLAGLPASLSRQLRAGGNTQDLDELVQCARILMVVDSGERQTAAVYSGASEVSELKSQIQELTAQVAALTVAQQRDRNPPRCYYCKQPGHVQRYCPNRIRDRRCYICGRPGHIAANCW